MTKVKKRVLTSIGTFLGIFLLFAFVFWGLLYTSVGQKKISDWIFRYFRAKLHTEVRGRLSLNFPRSVSFEDVFIQDQQKDTLIYANYLAVDVPLSDILKGKVDIQQLILDGGVVKIYDFDGKPNYSFIVEAFSNSSSTSENSGMDIHYSIPNIQIKNTKINYFSGQQGIDLFLKANSFQGGFEVFDPNSNYFILKPLRSEGLLLNGSFKNSKLADRSKHRASSTSHWVIQGLHLNNSVLNFRYDDYLLNSNALNLDVDFKTFDLNKRLFETSFLQVTAAAFDFRKTKYKKLVKTFDAQDIGLRNLSIVINDLFSGKDLSKAKIRKLAFEEKSGFKLEQASAELVYEKNRLVANKLLLLSRHSQIEADIAATLNTQLQIKTEIKRSRLNLKELNYFQPQWLKNPYIKALAVHPLEIYGSIKADKQSAFVEQLSVRGLRDTKLSLKGTAIRNLSNPNFDVSSLLLKTSAKDVEKLFGKISSVTLPSSVTLNARLKGNMSKIISKGRILTDRGGVDFVAKLSGLNKIPSYESVLDTKDLNVGYFTKNKDLGLLNGQIKARGRGFDPKTLKTEFEAKVYDFWYQGKKYTGIRAEGFIEKGVVHSHILADYLGNKLSLDGQLDISDPNLQLKGTSQIEKLDLKTFGLSSEPIVIKGNLSLDKLMFDFSRPDIQVKGSDILIEMGSARYDLGNLDVIAKGNADSMNIDLITDFADLEVRGAFDVREFANLLLYQVQSYFKIPEMETVPLPKKNYNIDIKGQIRYHPVFGHWVKGLKYFEPVVLKAEIEGNGKPDLRAELVLPLTQIDSLKIGSTRLFIKTENQALTYQGSLDYLTIGDFRLKNADLRGEVKNDQIDYSLLVRDSVDAPIHALRGNIKTVEKGVRLNFVEDGIKFFYKDWLANPYGYMDFTEKGVYFSDVKLSNRDQTLKILTDGKDVNDPVRLYTKNIDLNFISKAVFRDSTFLAGKMDTDLRLYNLNQGTLGFEGDYKVDGLEFATVTLGDLKGKAKSHDLKNVEVNAVLSGLLADLSLDGTYGMDESQALDFQLRLLDLSASGLQPIVEDYVRDFDGKATADLKITGKISQPEVEGDININWLKGKLVETSASVWTQHQQLRIQNSQLRFNDFKIYDADSNTASLNGKIELPDIKYDLSFETPNFKILDAAKSENDLFFGTGYAFSDLKMKGEGNLFFVSGDLRINPRTDITYLYDSQSEFQSGFGDVLEFRNLSKPEIVTIKPVDRVTFNHLSNAININLELDEKAVLKVLMDPLTGDHGVIQGKGKINAGYNHEGELFAIGKVDILKGSYDLTVQVFQRNFKINPNSKSNIIFTGDPLDATIEITAQYDGAGKQNVKDLLEETYDVTDLKAFDINIPVRVDLALNGKIQNPRIEMKLVVKEKDIGDKKDDFSEAGFLVEDREGKYLNDVNTGGNNSLKIRPNAAISLLAGGKLSFVANPADKSAAGAENLARNALSDFLNSQLSNYTDGLIKGVDLDVGVKSSISSIDSSRVGSTNVNIGLSKKISKRFDVYFGKNFELEDKAHQSSEIFDNIHGTYLITKDGRFRVKVFRNTLTNVGVVEGNVVENGLGLSFGVDFEHWKNLIWNKHVKKK